MITEYKQLNQIVKQDLTIDVVKTTKNAIVDLLPETFGEKNKNAFADKALNVITSNAFLAELDSKIGNPKPDESEDEYVSRCSRILNNLLHIYLE